MRCCILHRKQALKRSLDASFWLLRLCLGPDPRCHPLPLTRRPEGYPRDDLRDQEKARPSPSHLPSCLTLSQADAGGLALEQI